MDAGLHHRGVGLCHNVESLECSGCHQFGNVGKSVDIVARVDALWAIGQMEVDVALEVGCGLEDGEAILLGAAGVDGALYDHNVALFEYGAYGTHGLLEEADVWHTVGIDGGGGGNNMKIGLGKILGMGGEEDVEVAETLGRDLLAGVLMVLQHGHTVGGMVVSNHGMVAGEGQSQGEAYIAKACDGYYGVERWGLRHREHCVWGGTHQMNYGKGGVVVQHHKYTQ